MVDIAWVGSPNHYNGRNGYKVTHITLHIMVGRLSGTDATFQNAARQASSTYGIGSTGLIHQYVRETDAPWTDSNYASNCQTISIEHEGGMAGVPCTRACMDASAALCADIARRYGWTRLWHDGLNGNVWLHREIPGSDHAGCPDRAVNGLDVDYVINKANELLGNEDDMPSAQEIAAAVWEYNYKDSAPGGNMYNCLAFETPKNVAAAVAQYDWKDKDGKGGAYGGNLYNELRGIWERAERTEKAVAQLQTLEAAQSAAIDALSKAMGADPDAIAKIVTDAVRAKLDALEISVTATDKTGGEE